MNKKTKNWLVVSVVILSVVLLSACFYLWQVWWPEKQVKIQMGLAVSEFPWRDYTQAELEDLYPQIRNAKVPTRITPEETYTKFREALRTNNLELALEQLARESSAYKENKEKLQNAYSQNKFISSLTIYPENFWRSSFGESIGNLCYNQEVEAKKIVGCTSFIKNSYGDWKMDSL